MAPDLAISRTSSPSSLYLPGLATISLSLISSPIGLQIQPQPEMARTGLPPSVVTRSSAWWWNDRWVLGPLLLSLRCENSMILAQSPPSSSLIWVVNLGVWFGGFGLYDFGVWFGFFDYPICDLWSASPTRLSLWNEQSYWGRRTHGGMIGCCGSWCYHVSNSYIFTIGLPCLTKISFVPYSFNLNN